ncbi:MAG: PD40 domain-containing protein, partial [Massilia sp.]|nr:PD40 domain-containing protein [Massilia sp.]
SGLVFSSERSQDVQYKVWQVKLANRALARVTFGTGAEGHPVVSPRGRRLA